MTETPTPDEIARWAAVIDAASGGPWYRGDCCATAENFALTTAAVDNFPRLLALVAAQAEQNAVLTAVNSQVLDQCRIEEAEIANLRAELSALHATDEYQRWAALRTERDGYRDAVARVRAVVDAVLAQALTRRSLPDTRRAIDNVRAEIRAALDQPTPREETPT